MEIGLGVHQGELSLIDDDTTYALKNQETKHSPMESMVGVAAIR